ncbi:MAG: contractile injection system tape measure protein [Verrucomicrobiota bacterium]
MHVIGEILIETRAAGQTLARHLDRGISAALETELPIRLGECFDRLGGDRERRFGVLEIDLGTMSRTDFERGFSERVVAALMAKISVATSVPGSDRPPAARRLEAWIFFLRHGYLPWWFPASRWPEIASPREIHAADPARMVAELRLLAAEVPAAMIRLARQFPTEDLAAILGVTEAPNGREFLSPLQMIATWLFRQPNGAKTLDRLFTELSPAERKVLESAVGPQPEIQQPESNRSEVTHVPPDHESTPDLEPISLEFPTLQPASHDVVVSDAGISVQTAGLILLHPFIGRLFRHLCWLEEAGDISSDFRWHAVQALQFLALGHCGLPEPTLVLEKTLCGIPLHEPAEFPSLNETVTTECDHLLESVIGHWSILGKTSIGGLRESFLTRPGLMVFEENRIDLAVERQPYDMLLAHLPWPLGPVRFKWLTRPIHVRWT